MFPGSVRLAGTMDRLEELALRVGRSGGHYLEFLRVPAMSAGVLRFPAGATDTQTPHEQDEIYYVARGRAHFRLGEEDRGVGPGDLLFVPAHEAHRFHTIEEELVALVVFAPAETPAG
jgi:mannose-6-phosphate isomerase-like protein (cupin superfamily)